MSVRDVVDRGAGLTFCPDVCPITLNELSDRLSDLGPEAERLVVALIIVDPERDGRQELAEYLSNFDPRILGLTGTARKIGRRSSNCCIGLYNEHVVELCYMAQVETQVLLV